MKRLFVFKSEKKCLFKSPSPLTKKLHLATQFHPELNKEENLGRYRLYAEAYSIHMSEREKQDVFDRFIESPHTEMLISRFLNIVFGERLDLI